MFARQIAQSQNNVAKTVVLESPKTVLDSAPIPPTSSLSASGSLFAERESYMGAFIQAWGLSWGITVK